MADDGEESRATKTREGRDLDRITDYEDEKSGEVKGEAAKLAVAGLAAVATTSDEAEQKKRELEWSKIAVKEQDVELISSEFGISKELAKRSIQMNQGNVKATIHALLHQADWQIS
eukprot:TRINITY_DN2516_c0_g1_i1.p1 TRINITY_DN2516_c0_g1~~TRINITY_DN2516_c0_g1_i1.p1  ORF type:complete len:116 (-),score=46.06 TRINITY_DN2516_c0_g1_i1:92-439(-)